MSAIFARDMRRRIAVHDVGVAFLRDQILRRLRFAAGIDRRARRAQPAWVRARYSRVCSTCRQWLKRCCDQTPVHHVEPLRGAAVAVVVLLEMRRRTSCASCSHQDETTLSASAPVADVVDVRGLLGEQRGRMERGRTATINSSVRRDRRQRRGRRPGIQAGRIDALDVVQVEFRDERQVVADLLAAPGELAGVLPGGRHPLRLPRCAATRRRPASSSR